MFVRLSGFAGACTILALAPSPVAADPGDYYENRANKVADCDKKLREAQSRREFNEKAVECDRELAKFDREWAQKWRKEARERREKRRYRDWDD